MTEVNKRAEYICWIGDNGNKPEFWISTIVTEESEDGTKKEVEKTFGDSTARGAWLQVVEEVAKLRKQHEMVSIFPDYITGEDLFGLNEPSIVKVTENSHSSTEIAITFWDLLIRFSFRFRC